MITPNVNLLLILVTCLGGALSAGCSAGAHAVSGPLAPSALDCRPGESSTVCCIKKFPLTPVESCGASLAEVDRVLSDMSAALHAAQALEDDFAHNAHLPEWKQLCIKGFVTCKNEGWTGSCYDCLRRCEGQQEWPAEMCGPRKKKKRR
jgi:hypothetical protein